MPMVGDIIDPPAPQPAGPRSPLPLPLQVAAELRDAFGDRVCWVPLAALGDPALVLPTIAAALGVREGGRPLLAALRAALADQRVLLLLDNCEHLLAAAPAIGELLAGCPRLIV